MNRRSLLRLIGLAPVAAPMAAVAAKAAPQGFGARLMLIDPWSSMVGSTLEPGLPCVEHLRIGVTGPSRLSDAFAEKIASRDFSVVTFADLHAGDTADPEPSYLDLYPDELQPGGAA